MPQIQQLFASFGIILTFASVVSSETAFGVDTSGLVCIKETYSNNFLSADEKQDEKNKLYGLKIVPSSADGCVTNSDFHFNLVMIGGDTYLYNNRSISRRLAFQSPGNFTLTTHNVTTNDKAIVKELYGTLVIQWVESEPKKLMTNQDTTGTDGVFKLGSVNFTENGEGAWKFVLIPVYDPKEPSTTTDPLSTEPTESTEPGESTEPTLSPSSSEPTTPSSAPTLSKSAGSILALILSIVFVLRR